MQNRIFAGTDVTQTYTYTYDKLNRLLEGSLPGSKGRELLTYDKMGNIVTLQRGGTTSTLVDNLTYAYSGNRLTQVTDVPGRQAANIPQ